MNDSKNISPKGNDSNEISAMEILRMLKVESRRKTLLIYILLGVICVLIIALAATNIYHIYQWSQFDTVVVDSQDGGNASYIGNDGDIYNNGESSSTEETNQDEGNAN